MGPYGFSRFLMRLYGSLWVLIDPYGSLSAAWPSGTER